MITFAILAHNEVESVGKAVAQALSAAGDNDRVVVVDSASEDDTAARARQAGAEVVRGPLGKGAAMRFAAEGRYFRRIVMTGMLGEFGAYARSINAGLEAMDGKSREFVDSATRIGDIASHDLAAVAPDDPVSRAVQIMREKAVRRLPVVENGKVVGIVSIGDLALDRDPDSALADISAAPPNS